MKNKELISYSTVRRFGGYAIPVPIQTQLIRAYCEKNNFVYKLSSVESYVNNNFMYLNSLIKEAPKKSNIGMCSVFMLPHKEKFEEMQKKINEKQLIFHFIFEDALINYKDLRSFYMNSRLRFIQDNDTYTEENFIKEMRKKNG